MRKMGRKGLGDTTSSWQNFINNHVTSRTPKGAMLFGGFYEAKNFQKTAVSWGCFRPADFQGLRPLRLPWRRPLASAAALSSRASVMVGLIG